MLRREALTFLPPVLSWASSISLVNVPIIAFRTSSTGWWIWGSCPRGEPVETLRDLIREINYETWLRDSSSDPRAAERRMENVWELVAWLQRMVDDPDQDSSLEELLARIALLDILDRNANAEGVIAYH